MDVVVLDVDGWKERSKNTLNTFGRKQFPAKCEYVNCSAGAHNSFRDAKGTSTTNWKIRSISHRRENKEDLQVRENGAFAIVVQSAVAAAGRVL